MPDTTTPAVAANTGSNASAVAVGRPRWRLISPVDYGMAEEIYEGAAWPMAVELGVTVQVLMDYRQLLHDSGVCMQ